MSSSKIATTEPSASLLSSMINHEYLLEDKEWVGGPLHCQWGKLARRIVHESLQQSSAGEEHHESVPSNTNLKDENNKTDLATGSLGTWAYLQYELSKHCNNEERRMLLLTSARDFCQEVLEVESDINAENDSKECDEIPESMSILTNSEIGARLLLVVVYNEMDEMHKGRAQLRILLRIWKKANSEIHGESNENSRNNLWYGRAGSLQGIFFLRRELYSPTGASDLAFDIAKELLANIATEGDGMIFGRIGILYSLLGMEEEEWKRLENAVPGCQQTIQDIIEANYVFSVVTDGVDPSWATGVTGQILLLIRASQVFCKALYFDCAKQLAKRYVLPRCCKTSMGMCDGIVGVAFALRFLNEESAAERLVQVAIQNKSTNEGDECGIFDGLGGFSLLLMDMADRIQPSSFPFLHAPSASMAFLLPTHEPIFNESDLLAIDHFSCRTKASVENIATLQNGTEPKTPSSISLTFSPANEKSMVDDEGNASNDGVRKDEVDKTSRALHDSLDQATPDPFLGSFQAGLSIGSIDDAVGTNVPTTQPSESDDFKARLARLARELKRSKDDLFMDDFTPMVEQDSNLHLRSNADAQREIEEKLHQILLSHDNGVGTPSRQDVESPRIANTGSDPIQSPNVSDSYYQLPPRISPDSAISTGATPISTPARDSRIPTFSSPTSISARSQKSNASPSPMLKAALRPTNIPTPTKPNSVSLQLSRQTRIRTPPRPTAKSKAVRTSTQFSSTKPQSKLQGVRRKSFSSEEKGPSSPPRPHRLGTEYQVISEYQFGDRNGKLGRRIMCRCLDSSTSEGNLLTGGIGPCIYLRLQMSKVSENNRTQLLKASLVEAKKALNMTKKRAGAVSQNVFRDEYVGAKCLYIIILHRLGRSEQAMGHAEDLLELLRKGCASLPPEACDVLDGRAGILKTIWFLRSELENRHFGSSLALHISKQILYQGMLTAKKYNSESLVMWEWKSKPYLGAAHGVVGILHALLGHSDEEITILESKLPRVRDVILQAIESLDNCCDNSENLRKKLNDEDDPEVINMVHGAPGHCLLLAKASIAFPDRRKEFLLRATKLADSALRPGRINNASVGLMRGVTGIGYIFLALAQIDLKNASTWVSKAESIAHSAVDQLDSLIPNSGRPYSLFEGIGGLASLLFDLLHPESACFPLYDAAVMGSRELAIVAGESTQGITPSHAAI